MNICYIIVPLADITNSMINESLNTSVDTLRVSNDSVSALMKFKIDNVNGRNLFNTYVWYNHVEITRLLESDSNWIGEEL